MQQGIEKYTKAVLISKGWELRKIHDLETLFDAASKYEPRFKDFMDFGRELTAYYTKTRYPPLEDEIPIGKEAEKLLNTSKEFLVMLKKYL